MKRIWFLLSIIILLSLPVPAQNRKTTELTAVTSPAATDIFAVVINPGTSPANRKLTLDNLFLSRTGNKNVTAYASLSAAVTAISTTAAVIEIPATTTVSASLTIPQNITLMPTGPGMISVSASQTLTINGPLIAPPRHIFTGAGTVRLGSNIEIAYARWFGSIENNSTDDTAAIQKALDSFGNETSFRAGTVKIVGGSVISSTLTISSGAVNLEGTGWGISADSRPRGFLRWNGSAGSPMIKVQDVVSSAVRNIRLIGKTGARPSAGINFHQGGGSTQDQPIVENVYFGSYYSSDTDTGQQFDAGILFTGTVNGDTGMFRNLHFQKCLIGIDNQNGNASVHHYDTLTFGECGVGFKTVAPQQIFTNILCGGNDVDFELASQGVNMTVYNYVSEGSGRMLIGTAGNGYRVKFEGGGFHAMDASVGGLFETADFGSKRWFIDFSGLQSVGLSLTLSNFSLTQVGTPPLPAIRAWNTSDDVNPDGTSLVTLILDEVKGFTSDMIVVGTDGVQTNEKIVILNRQPTSTAIGSQRTTFIYDNTDDFDRSFHDLYSYGLGGWTQYGGPFKVKRLPTPVGVGATATGGSGTTYGYRVSALSHDGETLAAATVTCSGGATLGGGVFNTITWTPVRGAYAYKIYGRTSGSELLLATYTVADIADDFAGSFVDNGSLTPSGALPAVNHTGNATVAGSLFLGSYTTTERDALPANTAPQIIFNSTTVKFQGRPPGGAWVDFH